MARASLLLECAFYVNKCQRGQWPSWMQTYTGTNIRNATYKRMVTVQRTAAAMFYRWAEVSCFSFSHPLLSVQECK